MIYFEETYFKGEYREDFFVDETMKRLWAAEMELLSDIAGVCEKYNLQYYAYWGTLLGAIRHNGFVPWDDDMDIALKRKDYNILMEVLPKELPKTYRVYNTLSEKGHDQFWGVVTNADTISVEPERLKKFHGCPFWVGIDVVPIDNVPNDPEEANMLYNFISLIWKAVHICKKIEKTEKDEVDLEETLSFLENNLSMTFDRTKPLSNQLWRWGTLLAMSYADEECDKVTVYSSLVKKDGFIMDKSWWDSAIEWGYENITIPVPIGYDEVLKKIYGDYHVRVRNGMDHDYPYYKEQLRQLREKVSELEREREEK